MPFGSFLADKRLEETGLGRDEERSGLENTFKAQRCNRAGQARTKFEFF